MPLRARLLLGLLALLLSAAHETPLSSACCSHRRCRAHRGGGRFADAHEAGSAPPPLSVPLPPSLGRIEAAEGGPRPPAADLTPLLLRLLLLPPTPLRRCCC